MLEINFTPFPIIETERLVLREMITEDAKEVFDIRSNADAMRHINRPIARTIEDAHALIAKMNGMLKLNDGVQWGITLKNELRVVGMIGYHRIDKENHRAEIGYILHPVLWNKGIMSEAIKPVIAYAFNAMKLHSIEAKVDPVNKNSSGLLLKHKFVREGHFKEDTLINGVFCDTEVYSLLSK